jgi:ribose 1,5-bisphosphokinase
VLVNGSRAHLPQARARYGAALLPVCLQVSPDILRSGCKAGARKRRRSTSGWSARRAIPRRLPYPQ